MHNNSSLIAFSKIPNPTKFQKTLGVNDFYFGDPDDDGTFPYPLGPLQMLGKNDATLIAFDAPDAEDPADLARHSMDFWLTTEDLPLPGYQVRLGRDGRIRLRYTQTNAEAHRRLRGKFESLLHAIQCRDTVLPGYHYLGGRLGINAVAHQNGTVRFGTESVPRARPELQDARPGQPLCGRLELLRVEHGGQPDPDHHRQRPPRRRPHCRATRRRHPAPGAARTGDRSCLTCRSLTCSWSRPSPSWPR